MTELLAGLRSMVPDRRYALDELTGTQAYEWALNDVREVLRSDEARQKITEVLAANGVQPNTDAMHSWRCDEPDIYPGYCTCVPELVGDLLDALAGGDE